MMISLLLSPLFSLPSLSPSFSSSLFSFFWNCKHHSDLRAIKMNTGRIWPIGHNLPTSDLQPFHSDLGPLLASNTDFNNSWVPGVLHNLWEVVGYFRSICWENSLFPESFFYFLFFFITSAPCWSQKQTKGWHALSFPLNLLGPYWSVMAWGSRNGGCRSVFRDSGNSFPFCETSLNSSSFPPWE